MSAARRTFEPPVCPYCKAKAERVTGDVIYPTTPERRKPYHNAFFWRCPEGCDAYVGCHPGGDRPLGRLADAELRQWKSELHKVLDALWRGETAVMSRSDAYRNLAVMMKIRREDCHVGMFDVAQCQLAIQLLRKAPRHGEF